jgi:hypothetical protein
MKTVLLGYSSTDAKGPAKVIAGPEVDVRAQNDQFNGIKTGNSYPEGVVRVELCELVVRNVGILIGELQPKTISKKK